jgi:hypothetical protein
MRTLTKKQLVFISYYYFWLIFLVACAAFDFYHDAVTGFTFGYIFAFLYFCWRTADILQRLRRGNEEDY